MSAVYEKPRWLRDLVRFLPLRSQFVLSGNVRDLQAHEASPGQTTAVPLTTALTQELKDVGYGTVVAYDPVIGFRTISTAAGDSGDAFLRELGLMPANGC